MENEKLSRGGGNSFSPNATILAPGYSVGVQPKNLISAISEIQQFFVIEKQGQEIPSEFLTLEGNIGFFKIGCKSGFSEGMFLFLLFPVFHFYVLPFIVKTNDKAIAILLNAIPFVPVVINTFLCVYINKYYIGNITRKSINALFSGRALTLIAKGFVIYTFYSFLTQLSTPERLWKLWFKLGFHSETAINSILKMLPTIMPLVKQSSLLIAFAGVVPYGASYLFDKKRQYTIFSNQKKLLGGKYE